MAAGETLVLDHVDLLDGTGGPLQRNVRLVVAAGRVAAVAPATDRAAEPRSAPADGAATGGAYWDLPGCTALPGLINCHAHLLLEGGALASTAAPAPLTYQVLQAAARAEAMLAAGITTCRDVSGIDYAEMALRRAIAEGLVRGPRLLTSGRRITLPGGFMHQIGREADGPVEVAEAAREQVRAGADWVKLVASGGQRSVGCEPAPPELDYDALCAGVAAAAMAGRRAAAHAVGTQSIKNAVRAGVASLEHGTYLDAEGVDLLLEHGTVLVPTLSVLHCLLAHADEAGLSAAERDDARRGLDAALASYQRALAAGVPIACGSDAGTAYNPHADLVTELELTLQAGQTPHGAILTATRDAARLLDLADVGTLTAGQRADILVVEGDPLADLARLRRPVLVLQDGVPRTDRAPAVAGTIRWGPIIPP
jgi:imidazolonepropionase-like amidohydrolase